MISVEAATGAGVDLARQPVDSLAIDANNLFSRAWFADGQSADHAVRGMLYTILITVLRLRPRRIMLAFDCGCHHRRELLSTYKADRPVRPEEFQSQLKHLREASCAIGMTAVAVDGYEADDVLASIATQHACTVIVSGDKDLLALGHIARIWHPWEPRGWRTAAEKFGVAPQQIADLIALSGDRVDGIPGVAGIGIKRATKLLAEFGSLDNVIAAAESGAVDGLTGQCLRRGIKLARLSYELAKLVTTLPLPEIPEWRFPDGWRDQLNGLGLRSLAMQWERAASMYERTQIASCACGSRRFVFWVPETGTYSNPMGIESLPRYLDMSPRCWQCNRPMGDA